MKVIIKSFVPSNYMALEICQNRKCEVTSFKDFIINDSGLHPNENAKEMKKTTLQLDNFGLIKERDGVLNTMISIKSTDEHGILDVEVFHGKKILTPFKVEVIPYSDEDENFKYTIKTYEI